MFVSETFANANRKLHKCHSVVLFLSSTVLIRSSKVKLRLVTRLLNTRFEFESSRETFFAFSFHHPLNFKSFLHSFTPVLLCQAQEILRLGVVKMQHFKAETLP